MPFERRYDLGLRLSCLRVPVPFVLTLCYAGLNHGALNLRKSSYTLQIKKLLLQELMQLIGNFLGELRRRKQVIATSRLTVLDEGISVKHGKRKDVEVHCGR